MGFAVFKKIEVKKAKFYKNNNSFPFEFPFIGNSFVEHTRYSLDIIMSCGSQDNQIDPLCLLCNLVWAIYSIKDKFVVFIKGESAFKFSMFDAYTLAVSVGGQNCHRFKG